MNRIGNHLRRCRTLALAAFAVPLSVCTAEALRGRVASADGNLPAQTHLSFAFNLHSRELVLAGEAKSGGADAASGTYLATDRLPATSVLISGVSGPMRRGSFSLRPTARLIPKDPVSSSRTSGTGTGLRISTDRSGRQWTLSRCQGAAQCTVFATVAVGKGTAFDLGGSRWQLDALAPLNPRAGTEANVFLPSWSLQARERFSDGGFERAPLHTVLVGGKGSKSGIGEGRYALVDAQTGKTWLRFGENAPAIGEVTSAQWSDDGTLVVVGEEGALVVDFERDSLTHIGKGTLSENAAGLTGAVEGGFRRQWTLPDVSEPPKRLVTAGPGVAVWDNAIVAFARRADGSVSAHFRVSKDPIVAARATPRGLNVLALTPTGVRHTVYETTADTFSVAKDLTYPVRNKDARSYVLMASSALQVTTGGLYLLTPQGEVRTSLTGLPGPLQMDGHFGALLRVQEASRCQWKHYAQHPTVPGAFGETGITIPCGAAAPTLAGTDRASFVFQRSGARLQVQGVVRP